MEIRIPAHINAQGLLPFITLLNTASSNHLQIDFSGLRRVSPAGLAVLASKVNQWRKEGKSLTFEGLEACYITGYLQRMDLISVCEMKLPEKFIRHEAKGRFVPIRLVDHNVDRLGNDIAICVAPDGEDYDSPMAALYDLVWYVLTETANNVRQHSGGTGYTCAQVTRVEGLVRLAVSDNGKGIRQSFCEAGFSWAHDLSDAGAILKALEPKISSKGSPTNEGVGLTLIKHLIQICKGWLLIVSGKGVLRCQPDGKITTENLPNLATHGGTLIAITLRQQHLHDYPALLHQAKLNSGLLRPNSPSGKFDL